MIEYKAPLGGSSLLYPIKQATVDLSTANFTQLNSVPLIILPADADKAYVPLNIIIKFENINWPVGYVAYFNNPALPSATIWNITRDIFSGYGISCSSFPYISVNVSNTNFNQAFILTSDFDNGGPSFSQFIVTLTYIEYNP
jgi:hypothetical protein